jgi:hypothetical protein
MANRLVDRNGILRWVIVLSAPLLALGLDLYLFPLIFVQNVAHRELSLTDALADQPYSLGTFRAHRVFVSLDDIQEPEYLPFINGGPNALVISAYASEDDQQTVISGMLYSAVLSQLNTLSPSDNIKIQSKLNNLADFEEGQLVDFDLHLSPQNYKNFPVDHLLMIVLPTGHPDPDNLKKELGRVFKLTEQKRVRNIVVPALATRWDDSGKNSLSLNRFFQLFFQSIAVAEYPRAVYISLYKSWPSFELESATRALNSAWVANQADDFAVYRRDLRIVLASLTICLFVCGYFVKYTIKNFLIVSTSYFVMAFGANKWVDLITSGYGAVNQLILQSIVLVILAAVFPIIVMWNPKDIFSSEDKQSNA